MEAMGRLAGGIAHDFNNLLSVINTSSELLQEDFSRADSKHDMVRDIFEAGKKAASLTKQLLTFSRKKEVKTEILDVNTVVSSMFKLIGRIVKPNISLELSLAENVRSIEADQGQIEQILMNLVVNANDAMPQGGTITIATSDEPYVSEQGFHLIFKEIPHAVCINVKDSGTGIPVVLIVSVYLSIFTSALFLIYSWLLPPGCEQQKLAF